jgi:hypothetical protein
MSLKFIPLLLLLSLLAYIQRTSPRLTLLKPDTIVLYSLKEDVYADKADKDGREVVVIPDGMESFHGHAVLGKLEITNPAQQQTILEAMNRGLTEEDIPHKCFNPRHGLRLQQGAEVQELVICFQCRQLFSYPSKDQGTIIISASPQPLFNKILSDAGVPLNESQK